MKKIQIKVCMGSSCFSRGNNKNIEIIENFIRENKNNLHADIGLVGSLCLNKCSKGPVMIVNGKEYRQVTPENVLDILKYYIGEGENVQTSNIHGEK